MGARERAVFGSGALRLEFLRALMVSYPEAAPRLVNLTENIARAGAGSRTATAMAPGMQNKNKYIFYSI